MVALFGAVVSMFGHFLRHGPNAPSEPLPPAPPTPRTLAEDSVVGEHILRHGLAARMTHWSVALTFFAALLSGLPIWTPVFGWLAPLFGGLAVCRWLHPWAGVAFVVAVAAMFVQWLGQMRRSGDKYNWGQRLFFFLVAALALLLLATGLVLWFPLAVPLPLRGLGLVLHDALFLVFAVAIVVHIYLGTAANPGSFRSMTRGTVSKSWARHHHPAWARRLSGDDDPK